MKRIFRYSLIIVYLVLCLVISLYFQFPSERALTLIRQQMTQRDIGWAVDGREIKPVWPAGLKLENARIAYQGATVAEPEWIRLNSTLASMIRQKPETRLTADVWEGRLDIQVVWDDWRLDRFSKTAVDVNQLEIGAFPYDRWAPDGTLISGKLFAKGAVDLKNGKPESGTLRATVADCRLEAPFPIIPKMVFVFDRVDLKTRLRKGNLEVTEGAFSGELLNGRISGNVNLSAQFGRSRLNLEITVVPTSAFMQKLGAASALLRSAMRSNGGKELKIRLQGTVERPRLTT